MIPICVNTNLLKSLLSLSHKPYCDLFQARGVYSDGEDQTGAAGQLYLVRQEEEAV